MAIAQPLTPNLCLECESQVEIPNDDIQFSLDLHMQSHKTLETISQEIDNEFKKVPRGLNKIKNCNFNYPCPDCGKNIEILNNDISLSIQLHSQNHTSHNKEKYADQFSITGVESKSSDDKIRKVIKEEIKCQPVQSSIIDSVFNAMPRCLTSQREFFSENGNCNICKIKVEPIFSISDHLKTKAHEDNIILFLKKKLSINLHQIMEYVSVYGSNLSCNLCSCKIKLCSSNAHETIINIMEHNAGKTHTNRKTTSETQNKNNEALLILKYLSQANPIINDSKQYIHCQVEPQFKCKLCDKQINYEKNEHNLLKNFITHLTSIGHQKCIKAISVFESFEKSYVHRKEKHCFVILKGKITCTICGCNIEANVELLNFHLSRHTCLSPNNSSPDLASKLSTILMNSTSNSFDTLPSALKKTSISNLYTVSSHHPPDTAQVRVIEKEVNMKNLLNALPEQFKNITFVVGNDQGQITCLVCNLIMSASPCNLEIHLKGKKHIKNEKAVIANGLKMNDKNSKLQKTLEESQIPATATRKMVYDSLLRSDPIIALNNKIFAQYEDGKYYICMLCWTLIQSSSNRDIFRKNIHFHIETSVHKYNVQVQNEVMHAVINDNSNPIIREIFKTLPPYHQTDSEFIKALSNEKNSVFCVLCNCKVSTSLRCLQEHLTGSCHITSLERFNVIYKDRQKYLLYK